MEINILEKRMESKTSECHRIWQKLVPLLLLGCFCFVVDGQIGITSCTVDTAANCPNYLPNSYCNVGTLLCECPAGYVANAANIGCEYECGALAAPGNGAVDTSAGTAAGDIATFSCDSAYKLSGSAISTCVDSTGWDNTATRCVPAELGDSCATNIFQCNNIVNGQCQSFSTCECLVGYEDNGTKLACTEIDECTSNPCENGGACVDELDSFSCDCVAGYIGTNCEEEINECNSDPCQNGGTCLDGDDAYLCSCVAGYTGTNCETSHEINICHCDTDSRGTDWSDTPANVNQTSTCNESFSVLGQIYRTCGPGGQWQLPVYDCVREAVQNIEMSVEALDLNSSSEDIVTAINDIASVTSQTGIANASDKITNGELAILTSSLKKIATLLPSQLVSNDTVTDRFIGCVDNLIDDTNIDTWKSETDSTSAEQILSAIDSIAEALTVTAEQDEKRLITKKNIAIQAQLLSDGVMVFPDSVESFDQDWINQTKSSIRIQSQSSSNSTEAYVATAVIYRNMSGILPNTYSVTGETISERKDTEKKVKINGPVLAMTIPSHLSRSLDSPITITFEHYNNNLTAPICVFWQYKSDSQGFWSDDGCRNKSTNTSSTVCECDHLTNFAVLMSPFQPVDEVGSSSETMVLHIVSIAGISTSILCLIATFVIHFALWKNLKSERTTLLIHLCVALFVAYIVFLAGINRTENKAACTAIAAFLHYIYLVVFCIMLAEGIQIAMIVLYVFKTKSKLKLLLSIAWGVPAVIVGISVLVTRLNGYGNEKFCWLSIDNGLIWSFVGPAVAVVIFNTICIGLVIRALCSTKAMETKPASEKVKATLRSLCVLLPIMGISWIVGLFYIDDSSDVVQYIFAILNGLQGFFIFLFHCLLNKQIREAIKLRQKRQSSKIANQISIKRSTLTADSSQERSKGSTDGLRYIGESRHQLVREASASTEYSFTEPFGSHEFTTYTTVEPQNNLNNGTMKQEVMFPGEDLTSGMMRQNLYIRRDKSKSTLTADSSQESSKGPTYSRHYIGESRHQSIREASSATEHSLTEPCDSRDFATLTNVEPQDNLNNGTTKHEEMFPVEDINLFTDFINHRSDATKPLFQAQHDNGVSIDQINQISHIDID